MNIKIATKTLAIGVVGGLLLGGPRVDSSAAAEEKMIEVGGKKYPLKNADEPVDFSNPRRFELPMKVINGEKMKVTPEGVPFAWDKPRKHALEKEYRKIKFPLDKVFAGTTKAVKGGTCLTCHEGIEKISDSHDLACIQCHKGNDQAKEMKAAHAGMYPNPADGQVVAKTCGTSNCHSDQLHKVETSLMATAAGEINATRYAWGAQEDVSARYSVNGQGGTKLIPTQKESGQLVDDFLRKKCVRCHINSPAPNRLGEYRATGCAACHMIYANDGQTQTGDKAILAAQKNNNEARDKDPKLKNDLSGLNSKRGYPIKHRLTTAIPTEQCVRCHSGNRVGTEYIGLFEHDTEKQYRSPRFEWNAPPSPYGMDQHTLVPDVHYRAGLACIDCHTGSETMGNGKTAAAAHQALEVSCDTCHGTPETAAKTARLEDKDPALKAAKSNRNLSAKAGDEVAVTAKGTKLAHVKKTAKGLVLTSKVTGKEHLVPQLKEMKKQPTAHTVAKHVKNMECSACHSGWTSMDYATHLMREDYPDFGKWAQWRESDPQTLKLLTELTGSLVGDQSMTPDIKFGGLKKEEWPKTAESADLLTGEKSIGIWFSAYSMRFWEDVILGRNPKGKVSMFKPQYQYIVSHIGPDVGKLRAEENKLKKELLVLNDPEQRRQKMKEIQEINKKVKSQIFMDSQLVRTKDQRPGLVMNAYSPHTIQGQARSCEECHANGQAVGLGRSIYYRAKDSWTPQLDSARAGLPMNFQLQQVLTADGKPLQITTQQGARFFNKQEMTSLLNKSDLYKATWYLALQEQNFGTLLERKEEDLTGGGKRMVKKGVSLGDVRQVGSYYDTKRYGFWQTDPAVFLRDYLSKGQKRKTGRELWNDPVIQEEKKHIEEGSRTYLKDETTNFNWVPKKQQ